MRKGLRTLLVWLAFLVVLIGSAVCVSAGGMALWVGVAGFGVLALLLVGLTLYAYLRNRKPPAPVTRA
jgi:hypothetical protein